MNGQQRASRNFIPGPVVEIIRAVLPAGIKGVVGEVKYLGPLTAAGLIMIASGPVGAAISGLVAAGITGLALRELLDDIKATPHTEAFARALEYGAVLLWVRAATPERQTIAREVLVRHGAADVHQHLRETGL